MTQLLPPKKEVTLALLEQSNVDVYLDPRARGVVVPPQFRKEPRLILKIGLNMPVPIHDLRVDEESLSCTLSFNRTPFFCVVPWSGVFALVGEDGRGMVWPDDVPRELAVKGVEPATDASRSGPPSTNGATAGRRAPRGSKLAEERSPARARGRGAKKDIAKKEESRAAPARLVAVPSLEEGRPSSRIPPSSPSRPPAAAADSARPKRELPPYLRVVK